MISIIDPRYSQGVQKTKYTVQMSYFFNCCKFMIIVFQKEVFYIYNNNKNDNKLFNT
jgi:hypothetical protein